MTDTAFDFVPNRAKLAFSKVDETIESLPLLIATKGKTGHFFNGMTIDFCIFTVTQKFTRLKV